MTATLNPTTELLSHDEFRAALAGRHQGPRGQERLVQQGVGRGQARAPPLRPLGREPLPLRRPLRRLPGHHLRQHPGHLHRGQGLPAPEHVRGGAGRHPAHRPAHPLRRGVRHHPERIEDPNNANAVTRGLQAWCYAIAAARALRRRHGRPRGRPGVAGARASTRSRSSRCARSTGSPRTRSSSSTCTSPPTSCTASAATRSCSTTRTPSELQQRCLQFVRWGAEMRFSYTRSLYDTYVAPDLDGAAQA